MLIKALYSGRFIIFLSVLGLLLWGLFKPTQPPQYFAYMDKVLHLIAFFVTALTARYASSTRYAWLVWAFLFVLAFASEHLQHLIQPHRSFNHWDIVANLSGVFLAMLLWPIVANFAVPQHNSSDDLND